MAEKVPLPRTSMRVSVCFFILICVMEFYSKCVHVCVYAFYLYRTGPISNSCAYVCMYDGCKCVGVYVCKLMLTRMTIGYYCYVMITYRYPHIFNTYTLAHSHHRMYVCVCV